MARINMADPFFSPEDRKLIHEEIELILDGALSMGPNVRSFEEDFAKRVGARHAIAMNSCTSTLEAALLALGAAGREVIVPSETFIATGMAVHLVGAKPVFAEISKETLCLDIEDVKLKVNSQTAGVIIVHMAGLITPDIRKFREFCDERGLFLIEDAAHSLGATLGDRESGTFGHVGCFSFFPTKVITSGEGGMLTTDDDEIAAFARSYQHRGRDLEALGEQYVMPGRNVRMTEMSALLGRVQLGHLDEYLEGRRRVAAIYINELSQQPGLTLIHPHQIENSSFWKFPIVLDPRLDRARIAQDMSNAGISVDWAYAPAVHLQPVFRRLFGTAEGLLPITEEVMSRHLCLPSHPRMSDVDAAFVAKELKGIVAALLKEVEPQ